MTRLRDVSLARVICVSNQTRQDHLERLRRDARKCLVVPNCVDLDRFAPRADAGRVRAQFGIGQDAPVVGTVSRLGEHRKGIHHFLEMAADVAAVDTSTHFLIVGDGPLRSDLEQQADQLGIRQRVTFAGERQDIPELLSAMQVFVMPSLYEAGPFTVLEAMAMEKPVVSTPVGLVPDVIQDGVTGRLAPVADSAALSRAVLDLLADAEATRRIAERGRVAVVERFALDRMIDGVAAVYRDVA
jgi:glycosyltransferase involved in cell wall biosynthesis